MLRVLKNKSKGESIVEIIVTAIIFVMAAAGILTTISMLKPHEVDTSNRLEAAYFGKRFIDQLRQEVDASTWNDAGSSLYPGTYSSCYYMSPSGVNYQIVYEVKDEPGLPLRHISINIIYPD